MVKVLIRSEERQSGFNNDSYYYIDWNRFLKPNTKYEVSFTYTSIDYNVANSTTFQISDPAILAINLGQDAYDVSPTGNANTLSVLGLLEWETLQTGTPYTGFLKASSSFNSPIIINSIPSTNFNIKVYDSSLNLWHDTDTVPKHNSSYMLLLDFKEC